MTKTITILKQEISFEVEQMDTNDLSFFVDNPRIYSKLQGDTLFGGLNENAEKKEYIKEKMWEEQSVKNLIPEIKRHGGLINPILVKYSTREVIEGNSRLAAYLKLRQETPTDEKWHKILCHVVSDLTNEQTYAYLHGEHVKGKTPWKAYEKAYMAYKYVVLDDEPLADYAKVVGETKNEINKQISIILLMKDNNDKKTENWSYYDVLVRIKKIAEPLKLKPEVKKFILREIKNQSVGNESFTAQDLRNKFPTILSKPKILKKLMSGNMSFQNAHYHAKSNKPLESIKAARAFIKGIELPDIEGLEVSKLNVLEAEIRRCNQDIDRLEKMIKKVKNSNE